MYRKCGTWVLLGCKESTLKFAADLSQKMEGLIFALCVVQTTCLYYIYMRQSFLFSLSGHSQRVLHLALNSDSTLLFSAAADQRFHIWDMKRS